MEQRTLNNRISPLLFWLLIITLGLSTANFVEAGQPLASQTNREGGVTVKVTPLDISANTTTWRFEVVLDTHTNDLSQEILAASALIGNGKAWLPIAWEGDGPGGHHRKGVLVFDPIHPTPTSIALKLYRLGGVTERIFIWPMQ